MNTRARLTTLLTVAALLSVATPSLAQQDPVKPVDVSPRTDTSETPAALLMRAKERAFLGETRAAVRLLRQVVERYPSSPEGQEAAQILRRVEAIRRERAARVASDGEEKREASARAELVIAQTIHGIALGGELCGALGCDDGRLVVGSLLLGGGLGLGLSLGLTREGIQPGFSSAMNSGTVWGLWHGVGVLNIVEPRDDQAFFGILMAGQLAGLGIGAASYQLLRPRAGSVALANSGALWGNVLSFILHGMNRFDASDEAIWASQLIATDVGLIVGGLIATQHPVSRGRALVIDAGGVMGFLVGIGLPVLILNEPPDSQVAWFGSALAGTIVGLSAATYFSRGWDAGGASDETTPQVMLMPSKDGASLAVMGRF